MKMNLMKYIMALLVITAFTITSCGDDNGKTTGNNVSYDLNEISDSGVSGYIKFVELENGDIQTLHNCFIVTFLEYLH